MNIETQYEVTERLQHDAVKQLFFAEYLKRKWIVIVALWLAAALSILPGAAIGFALTGFLAALGFVLTWIWAKNYTTLQKQGRDYLQAWDSPSTKLQINDAGLEISRGGASPQKFTWAQIERVIESKEFFIPLTNGNPVLFIPKSALKQEMQQQLRQL
ncbi:MAG: hypothetical protein ACI81V_001267 [Lentimonas sp.]|jgi:hypothetical protein